MHVNDPRFIWSQSALQQHFGPPSPGGLIVGQSFEGKVFWLKLPRGAHGQVLAIASDGNLVWKDQDKRAE